MIQQAGLVPSALDALDQATPELLDLTRFVHAHPEPAMQGRQAASLMTGCRLELGESETPYDDAMPSLILARARSRCHRQNINTENTESRRARQKKPGLCARDVRKAGPVSSALAARSLCCESA